MDIQTAKKRIMDFMQTNMLTVISTIDVNGNKPESAVIAFAQKDNFELIFGTYRTRRKYKNIKENNRVSFVIGWDEDYITVQYEGVASELSTSEIEIYVPIYHKKVPGASIYKSHPEQTYWKVTPAWIRYSDLSGEEEKIYEWNF